VALSIAYRQPVELLDTDLEAIVPPITVSNSASNANGNFNETLSHGEQSQDKFRHITTATPPGVNASPEIVTVDVEDLLRFAYLAGEIIHSYN
jgi:hypothetical protein